MPTSTALTVTMAGLPAKAETFTLTGRLTDGWVLAGTLRASLGLRSSRLSGRWTRPRARAGVTLSPWLPGRKAATVT